MLMTVVRVMALLQRFSRLKREVDGYTRVGEERGPLRYISFRSDSFLV